MRNGNRVVQMGTLVVLMLVGTMAQAGTQSESSPGTMCVAAFGPPNVQSQYVDYYGTSIINDSNDGPSPGARYIFCPLNRSYVLSTSGLQPALIASDPTGNMYCIASTWDEWGNSIASEMVTIPYAGNEVPINFSTLATSAWGAAGMFCVLPPAASVNLLLYEEFF